MGLEKKDKLISGRSVTVTQFTADIANPLFLQTVKYFGEPFFNLFGTIVKAKQATEESPATEKADAKSNIQATVATLMGFDIKELAGTVGAAVAPLDPKEFHSFCKSMLAYTDVDGQRINDAAAFNKVFNGNLLFMYQCLVFALGVNFEDFFSLGGIGGLPPEQTPKGKKSPASSKE